MPGRTEEVGLKAAGVGLAQQVDAKAGGDAEQRSDCLLYTSDAADERSSVDLGGRRIIKKKKSRDAECSKSNDEHQKTTHNGNLDVAETAEKRTK